MENFLPVLKWVETGTFILLAFLSVWSISLMIARYRVFKGFFSEQDYLQAEQMVRSGKKQELEKITKQSGLVGGLIRELLATPNQSHEALDAAARGYIQSNRQTLEKGLNVLATLGSNAPFIGLFATVLGIVQTFSALSSSSTGSPQVMASIASALLATAAGLFVAIPAVIAFNYFSGRLKEMLIRCESLKNLYVSRVGQI